MVELTPYFVPNFWTERNAAAKRRQMKRRGMPELEGGRFITVTVKRTQEREDGTTYLLSPEEAYELGKERLRRFIFRLKRKYRIRRWFWKMELHQPDEFGEQYAHWHFWFDYGGHIPGEELTQAWGLGRTDIRRVRRKEWDYLFKYMCKEAGELPEWLASKTKVRLFQTSMGFFPKSEEDFAGNDIDTADEMPSPRQLEDIDETQNDSNHQMDTIGERIVRWTRCIVARTQNLDGSYHHKLRVMEATNWGQLLAEFARIRFSCGIPAEECTITTNKITTWLTQLPPSLQGST